MNGKVFQDRVIRVNMPSGKNNPSRNAARHAATGASNVSRVPQLPGGFTPPPGPTAGPAPAEAAAPPASAKPPEMTPEQLWQALQDIRAQAAQAPDRVAALLHNDVDLAYALAQALTLFGVIDRGTPQQIVAARQAQAQAQALQQQQQQQQLQQQFIPVQPQLQPQPQPGMPMMAPPGQVPGPVAPQPGYMPAQVPMGPPLMQPQVVPQPQMVPQPAPVQPALDADSMEAMIADIKNFTPEQIMALPQETRDMVLQLLQ